MMNRGDTSKRVRKQTVWIPPQHKTGPELSSFLSPPGVLLSPPRISEILGEDDEDFTLNRGEDFTLLSSEGDTSRDSFSDLNSLNSSTRNSLSDVDENGGNEVIANNEVFEAAYTSPEKFVYHHHRRGRSVSSADPPLPVCLGGRHLPRKTSPLALPNNGKIAADLDSSDSTDSVIFSPPNSSIFSPPSSVTSESIFSPPNSVTSESIFSPPNSITDPYSRGPGLFLPTNKPHITLSRTSPDRTNLLHSQSHGKILQSNKSLNGNCVTANGHRGLVRTSSSPQNSTRTRNKTSPQESGLSRTNSSPQHTRSVSTPIQFLHFSSRALKHSCMRKTSVPLPMRIPEEHETSPTAPWPPKDFAHPKPCASAPCGHSPYMSTVGSGGHSSARTAIAKVNFFGLKI